MRNMVFATLGQVTVALHTKNPPSDEEWEEYLIAHKRYVERGMNMRFLIMTEGGAPTAVQRMVMNEMIADVMRRNPDCIRSAIITRSSFVRGVVTAISWFRPVARAFSPEHISQALAYLEVPESQMAEIEQLIQKLKVKIATPI